MSSKAEEFKIQGNELFQKGKVSDAIEAYTRGLNETDDVLLQAVLYSNRAASYLKMNELQKCVDDCTTALGLDESDSIRCKLLYRRAKANFLLHEQEVSTNELLQSAAKDVLTLLSIDKDNKEAALLLQAIRAKHALEKGTPVTTTLKELSSTPEHACRVFLGLLTNDPPCAMELGNDGVKALWELQLPLSLQVIACACSHPPFVTDIAAKQLNQGDLANIVDNRSIPVEARMAALSIWLRFVLDLEDDLLDDASVVQTCRAGLASHSPSLMQASLEVLSEWTSKPDTHNATPEELRGKKPREVAAIRKHEYEQLVEDKKRASDRSLLFLKQGGLDTLLDTSIHSSFGFQREMGVVLGRLFGAIEEEEDIKKVVTPVLGFEEGVTIEEIHTDFDEKEQDEDPLAQPMKRAQLTTSLLLGAPEVGVWALGQDMEGIRELIRSENVNAQYIASELVSAAASVEHARPLLGNLSFDALLESDNHDVRSGAASALAKLGLSDKALSANEGEVMGLLQVSVELLYDESSSEEPVDLLPMIKTAEGSPKPNTSIERGIEVLSYLASKTLVKEELAHGFRASCAESTALERLVELASVPNAGESLSAYGLATIFSLMAVSLETLRREAFAGKEISMEQYDELQALSKTSEEKDMEPTETDTPAAVQERIRRMASANVPRAMVKLMEEATDSTLEQILIGLNRMATEPSVRGLIVQQGALSACLKVEKREHPSDLEKNILRQARHCIAKCLVTMNPSLLTSSQCMGSIKPLMELIRESESTDLQQFEALLAITNLASASDETKERIVAEKGISTLGYAMFSDHEMVKRAGTEAMCNLVPHPAMMQHLSDPEHLRLWLAFASDVERNFECARAAAGCLAMSTHDPAVATALMNLTSFRESMVTMLECGNLEVMHRALVIVLNLVELGDKCRESAISAGLVAFCQAYVDSYHDGSKANELHFNEAEQGLMAATVDVAKQIVSLATE